MDECTFDRSTLERLVKLETKTYMKFSEMDRALDLAREGLEHKLEGMNQFQKRMDKLENTFATKDELSESKDRFRKELETVQKFVWIGLGIILAIEFIFKVMVK